MIPVDQSITGERGNCMSACLASLLELPIDAVPVFLSRPGDASVFDWAARLDDWLSGFGLYALHYFSPAGHVGVYPGVLHILTGVSPRGLPHAVIGKAGHVVHDPHPDKSGLVFPPDGYILLVPTWEGSEVCAAGGASVAGAGSGDAAVDSFLRDAGRVLADIETFRASLSPRDLLLVEVGLHASHMEEAIVAGDALRARAHLGALADLVRQLRGKMGP